MYIAELAMKSVESDSDEQISTQQEILDSLIRQIPVTVDVVRSSTSPDSCVAEPEPNPTVQDVVLVKMRSTMGGGQKPYRPRRRRQKASRLRVPVNFRSSTEKETRQVDLALTRFLLRNSELRAELLRKRDEIPVFFPTVSEHEMILFVTSLGENEDVFQMVTASERKEEAIRRTLNSHFSVESTRPLMVNVAAKINVCLSQQMIDSWNGQVFLRVDVSKSASLKIRPLTRIE